MKVQDIYDRTCSPTISPITTTGIFIEEVEDTKPNINIRDAQEETNQLQNRKQENNDPEAEYLTNLYPKKFHEYWQSVKNERIATANNTPSTKDWLVAGYDINSADTTKSKTNSMSPIMIYVPTKIKETLGEEWSIFKNAINKGFVGFKNGQSGIKYLNNKIAEIKVVTTATKILAKHYILENDHVFIFDQMVNHKEVEKNL